jgi:hypothetical protein
VACTVTKGGEKYAVRFNLAVILIGIGMKSPSLFSFRQARKAISISDALKVGCDQLSVSAKSSQMPHAAPE